MQVRVQCTDYYLFNMFSVMTYMYIVDNVDNQVVTQA